MHERPLVVFAGGGSGGHLYPALAIADAFEAELGGIRPYFVGAERGIEQRVLPERKLPHILLPIRGVERGSVVGNLGLVPALARSIGRVALALQELRPELVVLTGGYAAAPAGVAALLLRVPYALQEQNAWPGLVTRILAPWARQIHVAFPEAIPRLPARARGRAVVTGNPVRAFPRPTLSREAEVRAALGLSADREIVLVVGGSQGSRALNELLLQGVQAIRKGERAAPVGWQLLWVTGPKNHEEVEGGLGGEPEEAWLSVHPYLDDMPSVLPITSLALSRAGAMTTSELHVCGVPAVLVPLPTSAENHQEHNARALQEAGASVMIRETDASPELLWTTIEEVMADPARRAEMSAVARDRARPDAARNIAASMSGLMRPRRAEGSGR